MSMNLHVTNVKMKVLGKLINSNYFRDITLKCSESECLKYFHPICLRECLTFYNIKAVDDDLYGVIFCEEHSKMKFIKSLNNLIK